MLRKLSPLPCSLTKRFIGAQRIFLPPPAHAAPQSLEKSPLPPRDNTGTSPSLLRLLGALRVTSLHFAYFSFIAFSISAVGIAPSRPIFHASPFNSTIVDGSVAPVSPASNTSGRRDPSCFITCAALAQEENPEMFALVPVTGPSNSSINRLITSL